MELRLGFAMGGGVSLGTFSGAALSEAIKLAVLKGADRTGQRYDRVVIDVFSGASAGAMSLGVMLRTLVQRSAAAERQAQRRLDKQFQGDADYEALDRQGERFRDLIAAQVVQDVQEQIWVEDITLDRLLGKTPSGSRDLRYEESLLDGTSITEIARRRISFEGPAELSGRRLLPDRVLYACTLANVSPIRTDAREEFDLEQVGFLGSIDAATSKVHQELRVFDLYFGSYTQDDVARADEHPERWCRYHAGDEIEKWIGDLRSNATWAKIAATGVASGSFPFAFPPVVLRRKQYEFGKLWPPELSGREEFPFSYVDGGFFNNEPIREAFRLASFIDAQPGPEFERRIVVVDPTIASDPPSLRVPVHQRFALYEPNRLGSFDGYDLVRRSSLERLLPHGLSLALAVHDESTVIEADKVFQTRDRLRIRDALRTHLAETLSPRPVNEAMRDIGNFCTFLMESDRANRMIPAGALTLPGELQRVTAEEELLAPLRGGAESFLKSDDWGAQDHADLWLRALAYAAIDLAMGLTGKRGDARPIAIAPVRNPGDPTRREPISLPGGALAGFAGFASPIPRRYEVKLARFCAHEYLRACGLIPGDSPSPSEPGFPRAQQEAFKRDLERGLGLLSERVGDSIRQSHVDLVFPGIDAIISGQIAAAAEKGVAGLGEPKRRSTSYGFWVQVDGKGYELDGPGIGDQDVRAVRVDEGGPLYLITFVKWEHEQDGQPGRWVGVHLDGDQPRLRIDRDGLALDGRFCTIAMPSDADRRAADLLPNPIFVAQAGEAHRDSDLGPEAWELRPGVTPLDQTIFK